MYCGVYLNSRINFYSFINCFNSLFLDPLRLSRGQPYFHLHFTVFTKIFVFDLSELNGFNSSRNLALKKREKKTE